MAYTRDGLATGGQMTPEQQRAFHHVKHGGYAGDGYTELPYPTAAPIPERTPEEQAALDDARLRRDLRVAKRELRRVYGQVAYGAAHRSLEYGCAPDVVRHVFKDHKSAQRAVDAWEAAQNAPLPESFPAPPLD